MSVTDFQWRDERFPSKLRIGYYMDEYLGINLMGIPEYLKRSFDVVGIFSGHSLSKETKIKLIDIDGKVIDSKPIGEYPNGEKLKTLSIDLNTGNQIASESTIIQEQEEKEIYEVMLEDGRVIQCSKDHLLFVKRNKSPKSNLNNEMVEIPLKWIKEGDELICL